mmetsp:Transcript_37920/g.117184  ORF Transcript_37920/g.117184 Transcript_37920/m.117184 type:complete len:210 (-) Transcript_37920:20-649(-)
MRRSDRRWRSEPATMPGMPAAVSRKRMRRRIFVGVRRPNLYPDTTSKPKRRVWIPSKAMRSTRSFGGRCVRVIACTSSLVHTVFCTGFVHSFGRSPRRGSCAACGAPAAGVAGFSYSGWGVVVRRKWVMSGSVKGSLGAMRRGVLVNRPRTDATGGAMTATAGGQVRPQPSGSARAAGVMATAVVQKATRRIMVLVYVVATRWLVAENQ